MKDIHWWLAQYSQSHRNPTNIAIHKFCVPAIIFSLLGLIWAIPFPLTLPLIPSLGLELNWTLLFMALVLLFYLRLSPKLALGMLIQVSTMVALLLALQPLGKAWLITLCSALFVLAWIMQFVGHKIEGAKPSFLQDLAFLLIGPLWTLSFVYRKLKIKI